MQPPKQSPKPSRRMRGFEAAASLLRESIRTAGESRGFAVTRLLTHWAEIVGADVAGIAKPIKVGYSRDGLGATLTLLTTGAHAPMLEMSKPRIRERVNACYGYNAISRIAITQTAPTGFAEGQIAFAPAVRAIPAPDPALQQKAADTAAPIRDADLRAALATLAENILKRPAKQKGTP